MADVLTLGQQQINSSALSGAIEIGDTFTATTCSKCDNPTLDSALKQVPLPFVTTFIMGAY